MIANCQKMTHPLSESQEWMLTLNERMLLKIHVMMCAGCRNFEKQMYILRSMAHAYVKRKTNEDAQQKKQTNRGVDVADVNDGQDRTTK